MPGLADLMQARQGGGMPQQPMQGGMGQDMPMQQGQPMGQGMPQQGGGMPPEMQQAMLLKQLKWTNGIPDSLFSLPILDDQTKQNLQRQPVSVKMKLMQDLLADGGFKGAKGKSDKPSGMNRVMAYLKIYGILQEESEKPSKGSF